MDMKKAVAFGVAGIVAYGLWSVFSKKKPAEPVAPAAPVIDEHEGVAK